VVGRPRRVERPVRIAQVRPRERAEIGSFRRQDRVHLVGRGDVAHRHRPHTDLLANPIGERRLEHAPVHRRLVRDRLSARDIDQVDATLVQRPGDRDRIVGRVAAIGPIRGRDADRHGFVRRPPGAHRVEDLQRKSQTIFDGSTILIRSHVGERREEGAEQIAVGHVHLQQIEAGLLRAIGGRFVGPSHGVHVASIHRPRRLVGRLVRQRGRREQLPRRVWWERPIVAQPWLARRSFAPRVAELQRDLRAAVLVNVLDDPPPGLDVGICVDPRASRRDAPVGRDVGHLSEDEPGPTRRARSQVDEVEVVRAAVLGHVHTHRRDHDTIVEPQIA
jgi:hypothetical protein